MAEGRLPFEAGSTLSAVQFEPFVARERHPEIESHFPAEIGYPLFVTGGKGGQDSHPVEGAFLGGFRHGFGKALSAVRIDGVIPAVGGDENGVNAEIFRKAHRDGKHDPVAERDDGRRDVPRSVRPVGYLFSGGEKARRKELVYKGKLDPVKGNTIMPGKRNSSLLLVCFEP